MTSISASAGMPSIETSGEAGVLDVPAMVSSSAAISEPSCSVMRCGAEEQFGGAQHERIVAAVERVAQDHVHELIEEEWRRTFAPVRTMSR